MTKEEFAKLSETLKADICREIAYDYAVFVPKDDHLAITRFKSIVFMEDKEFLDKQILENAKGRDVFPFDIITGKTEHFIEAYYNEFKLGANIKASLKNYGEKGEEFNTYFEECLKASENTTKNAVNNELFRQLLKGNDVKNAIKAVGEVIEKRTASVNKLLDSLSVQMNQLMVLWDYQGKGYNTYRINAIGENCEDCQAIHGKIFNIDEAVTGETLPPFHPNCDCTIEILDEKGNVVHTIEKSGNEEGFWKYLQSSIKQLVLGNYTDDVNLLGTLLQVLSGLLGVDLPMDIRDLFYDVTNFELTKEHLSQTVLDTVALLPLVGSLKYADEAANILKHSDEIADTAKAVKKTANFAEFPKNIHLGRQGKHIIGHNNYKQGKSIFTKTIEEAQSLIDKYSGTGRKVGKNREIVDFENIIGKYVDPQTGKAYETTVGTIHYSKDGTHIVPERPKNWRKFK